MPTPLTSVERPLTSTFTMGMATPTSRVSVTPTVPPITSVVELISRFIVPTRATIGLVDSTEPRRSCSSERSPSFWYDAEMRLTLRADLALARGQRSFRERWSKCRGRTNSEARGGIQPEGEACRRSAEWRGRHFERRGETDRFAGCRTTERRSQARQRVRERQSGGLGHRLRRCGTRTRRAKPRP